MRPEADCMSMKILLKQVYGVHTTKIKSLEDEIDELKRSLTEAAKKLKNQDSECKRCVELEEAFNSCKAALHEQSKWFESLGQKLSTSNAADSKISNEKEKALNVDITNDEEKSNTQVAAVNKINLSSKPKVDFLKNLMSFSTDDYLNSLDLSTVPFQKNIAQEYSTFNPDSMVLVPNTLDLMSDIKAQVEDSKHKADVEIESKQTSKPDVKLVETHKRDANTKTGGVDGKEGKIKPKKRWSDDAENPDKKIDKLDKENSRSPPPVNKRLKTAIKNAEEKLCLSNATIKDDDVNISNEKKLKKEPEQSFINDTKKNLTPALDVKIHKISPVEVELCSITAALECLNDSDKTMKNDSLQVSTSPSLLPLNEKTNMKQLHDQPIIMEDINDFQIPSVSKKNANESGSWTSCNKKKLIKKPQNLKPVKSTSKFKMQLDALPPNYKKPSYRQTKLSKSIFHPKKINVSSEKQSGNDSSDFEINMPSTTNNSPTISGTNRTVDFDATCIPENYEYKVVSSGEVPTERQCKNEDFETSVMIVKDLSDDSEEEEESSAEMIIQQPTSKGKILNKMNKQESPCQLKNSFDRLPRKAEPDYKYKEETVRKKAERKQLSAFDCKECEKYYSDLGLTDEDKQKRMHKCSRHRAKFAPPPTPEHFWELEFPDTQECKARGYLNETQKGKLKSHRKRPL